MDQGAPDFLVAKRIGVAAAKKAGAISAPVRWPGHISNGKSVLFVTQESLTAANSALASLAPEWVQDVVRHSSVEERASGTVGLRPTGDLLPQWLEQLRKEPTLQVADRMGVCPVSMGEGVAVFFPSLWDVTDIAIQGNFERCSGCGGVVPTYATSPWMPPILYVSEEERYCYRCATPARIVGYSDGMASTVLLTRPVVSYFENNGWKRLLEYVTLPGEYQAVPRLKSLLFHVGVHSVVFGGWDCYRKAMFMELWAHEPGESADGLVRKAKQEGREKEGTLVTVWRFAQTLPDVLLYGFLSSVYTIRTPFAVDLSPILPEEFDLVPLTTIAERLLRIRGWKTVQEAGLVLQDRILVQYPKGPPDLVVLCAEVMRKWKEDVDGQTSPYLSDADAAMLLGRCIAGLHAAKDAPLGIDEPIPVPNSNPIFWQTPAPGRPN